MKQRVQVFWLLCIGYICAFGAHKQPTPKGRARASTKRLQTQLAQAIRDQNKQEVRWLLKAGVNANAEALGRFLTPLQEAIQQGNLAIIKLLIRHGADLEKRDLLGETALMLAVGKRDLPVIEELLRRGANTEVVTGNFRLTPLVAAAMRGHEDVVLLLARYGARKPTKKELSRVPDEFMVSIIERFLNKPNIQAALDWHLRVQKNCMRK